VRDDRRSRAASDEEGQVILLTALAMVMLLVMVALVVDIGKAYLVQRQLQAGVDAAALAGAQHLPVASEATLVAQEYGPMVGSKNEVLTGSNVTSTVTMRCVQDAPGCQPASGNYNAVNVKATSDVDLLFARVIGIKKLKVKASATACSPCTAKPLDVMLVLDRTGSMCQTGGGAPDPNCTDLRNAKGGMRTFLGFMDPTLDKVGLAVFPPARNQSAVSSCPNTPTAGGAYYGYDSWWPNWGWTTPPPMPGNPSFYTIVSLSDDYLVQGANGWQPNASSWMFQSIGMSGNGGCIQGAGTTHYASAVEEAQYQLDRNGRGDVQDVIIFLSDGAANTSPTRLPGAVNWPPSGHWRNTDYWRDHPCGAGVEAAKHAKDAGDIIYTIGYDLDAGSAAPEKCRKPDVFGHHAPSNPVESGYDAFTAIRAMATPSCGDGNDPCFYNKPVPGDLSLIFTRIAADLQRPAARLIDDNTQ
jgi:putative Flp pilus-assembly TadE/G-like protein